MVKIFFSDGDDGDDFTAALTAALLGMSAVYGGKRQIAYINASSDMNSRHWREPKKCVPISDLTRPTI